MLAENILSRRSIRKYKNEEVTKAQIEMLLEAGMLAPSAVNNRPWKFVVVTNRQKLEEMVDAFPYAKMLQSASAAIVVCGLTERRFAKEYFPQDCSAATQNILLQATSMGLGTCWCGVYPLEERIEKACEMLDIHDDSIPFNIIAVGIPDEEPKQRGFYEAEKVRWID